MRAYQRVTIVCGSGDEGTQQRIGIAEVSFEAAGSAVHYEIAQIIHAELRGTAGGHVEGRSRALDVERHRAEVLCW